MAIFPTSFNKASASSGAWFSVTNWVDAASGITSNKAIAELPPTNLSAANADTIFRATSILSGDSTITIDVDLSANRNIGVLAVVTTRSSHPLLGDQGSTLSGSDTIRHKLGSSAGAGDVLDTGVIGHGMVPGHGIHVYVIGSNVSARHWQVTINALSKVAGAPGGYVDFIRLWAGELFVFDVNAEYGAEYYWEANSSVIKAERSASEFVDVGESFRTMTLTFSGISQNELNYLLDFDRITAPQHQILFGLQKNSELGRYSMLCRNSPTNGLTYLGPGRYRKRMKLIESL